jgi:RNase P subunit RPR2
MNKKDINLAAEIKKREDYNLLCPFPYYSTETIQDLKIKQKMVTRKSDYNNVPVEFCKTCLSLHLKEVKFEGKLDLKTGKEKSVVYCIPCGNTSIERAHITEWEDFYEAKYGSTFLEKK